MKNSINIFFVCYGGGHAAIVDALADYLVNYKEAVSFKILALTTAYDRLIKKYPKNIVCLSDYEMLFSELQLRKAKQYGRALLEENHRNDGTINKKESVLYLGLSMLDLVEKRGEVAANKNYQEKQRGAFLPTTIIKKILSFERPKIVCTTNSPRFEKAALIVANELRIKNYELIDLFGDNHKVTAKNVIVMNDEVKQTLKKNNPDDVNYFCLGQPAIEYTAKQVMQFNRKSIEKKIGVVIPNRINIVFFSQTMQLSNADTILSFKQQLFEVFRELLQRTNVNFFIRTHPSESDEDYSLFKKAQVVFITKKLSLSETLALCDITVTPFSTVALESFYANKITCTFHHNLEGSYPIKAFTKKPFIFSNGFDELKKTLHSLINSSLEDNVNYQKQTMQSARNIVTLLLGQKHD